MNKSQAIFLYIDFYVYIVRIYLIFQGYITTIYKSTILVGFLWSSKKIKYQIERI